MYMFNVQKYSYSLEKGNKEGSQNGVNFQVSVIYDLYILDTQYGVSLDSSFPALFNYTNWNLVLPE